MLQIHTNSLNFITYPYDLRGIKPSGLLRHALEIPDQVVIWDQVYYCAAWNDQTIISI